MMDETVDFIRNYDKRNVERNMDSGCPFGTVAHEYIFHVSVL